MIVPRPVRTLVEAQFPKKRPSLCREFVQNADDNGRELTLFFVLFGNNVVYNDEKYR